MDKEKVSSIICKIEFLLGSLREELLSDTNSLDRYQYEDIVPGLEDYDEVFYGDDD